MYSYQCDDCGEEFTSPGAHDQCPHCGSYDLVDLTEEDPEDE